jgi:hypothetical protein
MAGQATLFVVRILIQAVGYLPLIGVCGWGTCSILFVSSLLVHVLCPRGIIMTLLTSPLLQVLRVPLGHVLQPQRPHALGLHRVQDDAPVNVTH